MFSGGRERVHREQNGLLDPLISVAFTFTFTFYCFLLLHFLRSLGLTRARITKMLETDPYLCIKTHLSKYMILTETDCFVLLNLLLKLNRLFLLIILSPKDVIHL